MKTYEGMFLINPELDEDSLEKEVSAIKNEIEKENGEVVDVRKQGKRKLAYPIDKKTHANYVIIYFKSPTTVLDGLKRKFRLNQNIMRSLIFIKDKNLPLNDIKD